MTAELLITAGLMAAATASVIATAVINIPLIKEILAKRDKDHAKKAGKKGEKKMAKTADKSLPKDAVQLTDLLLWKDSEKSFGTQIDSVLITPKNIYVIENKNVYGTIACDDVNNDHNWTHLIPSGLQDGKVTIQPFYSPVKQNIAHLIAIKKTLKKTPYANMHISMITTFNNECTLKLKGLAANNYVISLKDLPATIAKIEEGMPVSMDKKAVQAIADIIAEQNDTSEEGRARHLAQCKARQQKDKEALRQPPKERIRSAILCEDTALIKVDGEYKSIRDLYEGSLQNREGQNVKEAEATCFVCPLTKTKYDISTKEDFYKGLWYVFLTSNPSAAALLANAKSSYNTGIKRVDTVFRQVQSYYEGYEKSVLRSAWYRDFAAGRKAETKEIGQERE